MGNTHDTAEEPQPQQQYLPLPLFTANAGRSDLASDATDTPLAFVQFEKSVEGVDGEGDEESDGESDSAWFAESSPSLPRSAARSLLESNLPLHGTVRAAADGASTAVFGPTDAVKTSLGVFARLLSDSLAGAHVASALDPAERPIAAAAATPVASQAEQPPKGVSMLAEATKPESASDRNQRPLLLPPLGASAR